jgi:hypothetical protein
MNLDSFKHSERKSKDKNISNSFFKIINEMDLKTKNNKKAYEIYYIRKDRKVVIFFIDLLSKNI